VLNQTATAAAAAVAVLPLSTTR